MKRILWLTLIPLTVISLFLLEGCPASRQNLPRIADPEVDKLIPDFVSEDWPKVHAAKYKLESLQERSIPRLIELLDADRKAKLKNTMDLIYPGAEEFAGHGFIVSYDIDWISNRAGWVLEELAFQNFGFNRSNPFDKTPMDKGKQAMAIQQAQKWWAKNADHWIRLNGLRMALQSDDPFRQNNALHWLRFDVTSCNGFNREYYETHILPRVKKLAQKNGKKSQASYLLEDREFYWLSIKEKK